MHSSVSETPYLALKSKIHSSENVDGEIQNEKRALAALKSIWNNVCASQWRQNIIENISAFILVPV